MSNDITTSGGLNGSTRFQPVGISEQFRILPTGSKLYGIMFVGTGHLAKALDRGKKSVGVAHAMSVGRRLGCSFLDALPPFGCKISAVIKSARQGIHVVK